MKRKGYGRWGLLAVGWLLVSAAGTVCADEPPKWHPWHLRQWPGRLYYGSGSRPHTFESAGHPEQISKYAHPTDTGRYVGYYVGGGNPKGGRGPHWPSEGTWGWDYGGLCCWLKPKIELFWDDRYQGGAQKYQVDGPPVPDVGPYVEKVKEGPAACHKAHGE